MYFLSMYHTVVKRISHPDSELPRARSIPDRDHPHIPLSADRQRGASLLTGWQAIWPI